MRRRKRGVRIKWVLSLGLAAQLALAAAAHAGTITGTVSDGGGPLEGACVDAYGAPPVDGPATGSAVTNASGGYAISGLPAGEYRVRFGSCPGPPTHVEEYYNNRADYQTANPVSVTEAGTTSSIDATIVRRASISGSVTGPEGRLGGVCIHVFPADGGAGGLVGFTAPDGTFSYHGLRPAPYRVSFHTQSDCTFPGATATGFVSEFWQDEYLSRNADLITVHDGEQVTGIDAVVAAERPPRVSITGTVSDENGPRAGVCITALEFPFTAVGSAVSGSDGSYAIRNVEDGSYQVRFATDNCQLASGPGIVTELYSDKPFLPGGGDPVVVPDTGGISGIDELVNIPPDTTIVAGPSGDTGATDAVFSFVSDDPAATFECALDRAPFEPCQSPKVYPGVGSGPHVFSVRAIDVPGDRDPSAASASWTVVPGDDTTTGGTAPPGGTVSSDPAGQGPSEEHPVTTAVTVPAGGEVTVHASATPSTEPPKGLSLLGYEIVITAPPATVADPLRIVFTLDSSIVEGLDPSTITVLRDGHPAGECSGSRAIPDPCVGGRDIGAGGDLEMTVLASHASTWNFARAACVVPKLVGQTLSKAKKALAGANCKLGKVKKKSSPKRAGTVIAQKPKPKTVKPVGAKVAATVSKG